MVPVLGTTAFNWTSIAGDYNGTNLVATVDNGKVRASIHAVYGWRTCVWMCACVNEAAM